RLPPESLPFPYTTLFRSAGPQWGERHRIAEGRGGLQLSGFPVSMHCKRIEELPTPHHVALRLAQPRGFAYIAPMGDNGLQLPIEDRKSTRLNSSHVQISY